MDWIYGLAALSSAVAAVLAWLAKLWWGKEYGAAKDAVIQAKDAQIEVLQREVQALQQLTPMRIREYFLSVRQQLEEYNDALRLELVAAKQRLEAKEAEVNTLRLGKTIIVAPLGETDFSPDAALQQVESLDELMSKFSPAIEITVNELDQVASSYRKMRRLFVPPNLSFDPERLSKDLELLQTALASLEGRTRPLSQSGVSEAPSEKKSEA